jgi:hypothetical protein
LTLKSDESRRDETSKKTFRPRIRRLQTANGDWKSGDFTQSGTR